MDLNQEIEYVWVLASINDYLIIDGSRSVLFTFAQIIFSGCAHDVIPKSDLNNYTLIDKCGKQEVYKYKGKADE